MTTPLTITLTALSGPEINQSWELTGPGPHRVGRGKDCTVRLSDQSVSRTQFELLIAGHDVTLIDSGSRWGTIVNGRRTDRATLPSGTVIELGDTKLKLTYAPPASETMPPRRPEPKPVAKAAPKPAPPPPVQSMVMQPDDEPEPEGTAPPEDFDLNSLVGRRFLHFQVEAQVARAASGIVFRAVDTRTNDPVALKMFWPALFADQMVTARFLRSMRAMLPLQHEHVVKLYSAGRSHGHCFTASEFVTGESAAQLISRVGIAGMLDWRTVWKIALGLAKGLEYIHERNVLHRNLRPNNILIRKSDECVKLGDTMLAKSLDQLGQAVLTQKGELVGDLFYLSPEQVMGTLAIDQRTDLYSLGAALYALLTGKPPFLGGPAEVISKILNEPPVPPTRTHLTIPASFEGIVLRMLAKHPDGRFANATLVVKDLERVGRHNNLM